jgi:hypothetical protein
VPLGRRVGLQRLEEPLQVAMHVAHDQDRKICHKRMLVGNHHVDHVARVARVILG